MMENEINKLDEEQEDAEMSPDSQACKAVQKHKTLDGYFKPAPEGKLKFLTKIGS